MGECESVEGGTVWRCECGGCESVEGVEGCGEGCLYIQNVFESIEWVEVFYGENVTGKNIIVHIT